VTNTTQHSQDELEALVSAVEAQDLETWAIPAEQAAQAIEAVRGAARAAVFPAEVARLDPAAYAAHAFHVDHMQATRDTYGIALAALHQRSLAGHPDLARLLRSPEVLGDVHAAGASRAEVLARDAIELGDAAVERYVEIIARQLIDAGHELAEHASSIVLCANLQRRLNAAVEQHKARAAERLAVVEARRREADRARAMESTKRAAEAQAEAENLERDAAAARQRAQRQRAEALAERVSASGRDSIRTNQGVFGVKDVLENLRMMSPAQMDAIEAALEGAP